MLSKNTVSHGNSDPIDTVELTPMQAAQEVLLYLMWEGFVDSRSDDKDQRLEPIRSRRVKKLMHIKYTCHYCEGWRIQRVARFCLHAGLLAVFIFLTSLQVVAAEDASGSVVKIYENVAGSHPFKIDGTHATFSDGVEEWTIFGAPQKINHVLNKKSPTWSVGNKIYEVRILKEPVSNLAILPDADPVPNTMDADVIKVTACPGEYEPASFVIRSGNTPLEDVKIVLSPLKGVNGGGPISGTSVDIRIVKPWYQSASIMRRSRVREAKVLVPELLLHNDNLVRVDHANQVNLLRTWPAVRDTAELKPFQMASHENKQIWITVHVPENAAPGVYRGALQISARADLETVKHAMLFDVDVLPFRLLSPAQDMAMFYLGRWHPRDQASLTGRSKTSGQMQAEFIDMRAHGVDIVGLDHFYAVTAGGEPDFQNILEPLRLLRAAGFVDRLVYVDWQVTGHDEPPAYKRKLTALRSLASRFGFEDLWVYNRDEAKLSILDRSRHTFTAAKEIGARNAVAVEPGVASRLSDVLDVAIVQNKTSRDKIRQLKKQGMRVLAYGVPHAAEESPGTTRQVYGFSLAEKGFDGVFSYAYQSGYCWDDWMKWEESHYRPNVMAYPTVDIPIPTLQWEGWREGVDDLRYLATYLYWLTGDKRGKWPAWLEQSVRYDSPSVTRHKLVQQMRDHARKKDVILRNEQANQP